MTRRETLRLLLELAFLAAAAAAMWQVPRVRASVERGVQWSVGRPATAVVIDRGAETVDGETRRWIEFRYEDPEAGTAEVRARVGEDAYRRLVVDAEVPIRYLSGLKGRAGLEDDGGWSSRTLGRWAALAALGALAAVLRPLGALVWSLRPRRRRPRTV